MPKMVRSANITWKTSSLPDEGRRKKDCLKMDERDLLNAGFRYALSLVRAEPDAEDLVQESWLRLYKKRGRRINKSLLFRTIRNLFIDQYRRGKLAVFGQFNEEQEYLDLSSWSHDVDMMDLELALAGLRPEEREAIFLNSVEGYTVDEIADFTQRSRGTVLSLIHRGKQKMAKVLNPMGSDRQENSI
jgi:RNA polymerase sigma-70 factor (ECF subfamily)